MDYVGTDLKYEFTSSGDFDMVEDEWEMVFSVGSIAVTFAKTGDGTDYAIAITGTGDDPDNFACLLNGDGDGWIFLLDSTYFGKGVLCAALTAHIPDSDFSTLDNTRDEVRKYTLGSLTT